MICKMSMQDTASVVSTVMDEETFNALVATQKSTNQNLILSDESSS